LKALSFTQPWATAVAIGVKQYETRSWSTSFRGLLAIHAAKGFPKRARDFASVEHTLGRLPNRVPLGAIIATARIVGVFQVEVIAPQISAIERLYGDYSDGRYAWQLADVRALAEPIPCRGALSLWQVPPEIAARLTAEVSRNGDSSPDIN